ncbi:MAG: hypothetical protein ACYC8T_35140 [Myxococcaceae bacterium]
MLWPDAMRCLIRVTVSLVLMGGPAALAQQAGAGAPVAPPSAPPLVSVDAEPAGTQIVRRPDGRVCIETTESDGVVTEECRRPGHGWNDPDREPPRVVTPTAAPERADTPPSALPPNEPGRGELAEPPMVPAAEPGSDDDLRREDEPSQWVDSPRFGPVGSLALSTSLAEPGISLSVRGGLRRALSTFSGRGGGATAAAFLVGGDLGQRYHSLSLTARLEVLALKDIPVLMPNAYAYAFATGGMTLSPQTSGVSGVMGRIGGGVGWNAASRGGFGNMGGLSGGGGGALIVAAVVAVLLFGNVELYYEAAQVGSQVYSGPRISVGFGV